MLLQRIVKHREVHFFNIKSGNDDSEECRDTVFCKGKL